MKKITLSTFIIAFAYSINAYGQSDRPYNFGTLFFGGTTSYQIENAEVYSTADQASSRYKRQEFSNDMYVGFFVSKNIAVGLGLNAIYYRMQFSNSTFTENDILISSFVRGYIPLGLFIEGLIGIGTSNAIILGSDSNNERDQYAWGLGLGYDIKLSNKIFIEPMICYTSRIENLIDYEYNHSYKGMKIKIGVQVYLNTLKNNKKL